MTSTIELSLTCWVYIILAVYLFVHGVCVLNFMSSRTPYPQRLGYSIFTVGVAAAALGPLYGYVEPRPSEILILAGLAAYHTHRAIRIWRINIRRMMRGKHNHA